MENYLSLLKQEEINKLTSIKNKDELDKILRENIKQLSRIYFELCKKDNLRNYIPPSGKVLDENELFYMIDASLDMWLTTGRFNDEFERKLAEFIGVKYALTTNSGSSANLLAISALTSYKLGEKRLKEGDEVITVAAGFPTTVAPIIQNRLVPVFVDVEIGTYNIDTKQIEEAITDKTKAIFVAHTLGNPFNIERILEIAEKYNLWVIEDNCDALGSKYNGKYTGSFGHISTMSFYPAHHITTGEGGAVITNDYELYKIIMSFRDWGRDCWCPPGKDDTCGRRFNWKLGNLPKGYDHKYIYSHLGYNLKITDWQAALGLAQLEKLPQFIEKRKENFELLYEGLKEFEKYLILPKATENSEPAWFGFPITVKEEAPFSKFELVRYLENNRMGTRQLFAGNMLRHPAFIENDIRLRILNSDIINSKELCEEHYKLLPNTDIVMNGTFWIGVWPGLDETDIKKIKNIFTEFFKNV
ncbi:CDP-6-deoxy-D-xylo-4-hexulose-3-dehydrase [Persephonella hydrogeniphila]|uniref:CDP-6-deoxy-D-xylo-4-hexulose-3-dehydrase n=1 Tax=Persephonella hydrogeniphila TaxID=198703 RepID=A0A285N9K4_9AQUI|nr:lipopolysaccharide biosynthesis protein RfbH [Persephonella hydrogeniphila]SNZ06184.1 CDP-6-deoxy-D-xylo-4-hexulose-3-dehydrase [Persephonella hydrogeniphila]